MSADFPGRITDPTGLSLPVVAQALAARGRLTIQFSGPQAYSPNLLDGLNAICAALPDTLEVRFFGHPLTSFDARVLRRLPAVKSLSLGGLIRIAHEDEIAGLAHLRHLAFEVFEFSRPDFLHTLDLGPLNTLSLGETRKRDFDLAALASAKALKSLWVQGHSRGFDTLAQLTRLESLHLGSIGARQKLDVIAALPRLKRLTLLLGGREDVAELSSSTVESLQILRVKRLGGLGDLSRFPALRALRVEDQLQLESLDLSGARLEQLHVFNCKTLRALPGLADQDQLQAVFLSQTALDMDALRDFAWPGSLRSILLLTSRLKWNEATAAGFAAQGKTKQTYWWL